MCIKKSKYLNNLLQSRNLFSIETLTIIVWHNLKVSKNFRIKERFV